MGLAGLGWQGRRTVLGMPGGCPASRVPVQPGGSPASPGHLSWPVALGWGLLEPLWPRVCHHPCLSLNSSAASNPSEQRRRKQGARVGGDAPTCSFLSGISQCEGPCHLLACSVHTWGLGSPIIHPVFAVATSRSHGRLWTKSFFQMMTPSDCADQDPGGLCGGPSTALLPGR